MTLTRRFLIGLVLTALAVALFTPTALAAGRPSKLSVVVQGRGTEYVTSSGSTQVFPGHLQSGDRILGRDALMQGRRTVGYGNEICTVTFDDNDLCQEIFVLPGKGHIDASWLWVGRNRSLYGPSRFTGVIDGGTGAFASASGQFTAVLLPSGAPRITATFR